VDRELRERLISSKLMFEGALLSLRVDEVELPDGRKATREWVPHRGAVAIVPLLEDGRVVMIRQYRHAAGRVLWELPAGLLEEGEDPAATARRELAEETGYSAAELSPLFSTYLSPGFSGELLHLFVARGLSQVGASPEPDEHLVTALLPLGEAVAMVGRGEVQNAAAICGLLAVAQWPGDGEEGPTRDC